MAGSTREADVAAGGRGKRGGTAGVARLAGVGRSGARSHGDRRGREHRGSAAAGGARRGVRGANHRGRGGDGGARRVRSTGGRRLAAAPRAGVRGGTLVADSVGRGGRWGRPRSRTTRGHGGDTVPPGPAATRVRPAAGLLVDLGWAAGPWASTQPLAFS